MKLLCIIAAMAPVARGAGHRGIVRSRGNAPRRRTPGDHRREWQSHFLLSCMYRRSISIAISGESRSTMRRSIPGDRSAAVCNLEVGLFDRFSHLSATMLLVVTFRVAGWCTSTPSVTCTTIRAISRFFSYIAMFTFSRCLHAGDVQQLPAALLRLGSGGL